MLPYARSVSDPSRLRWSRIDLIALVLLMLVAGVLRLSGLSEPRELIFDETYYARDACWYVEASPDVCERAADAPEVHPPLGKWLIGIGIKLTGFDCPDPAVCRGSTTSFGWRVMPAIAGVVTVGLLFLLARRLFRSTLAATVAGGLLAFDLLHFVQSRTSMLDIFIPMFGVAGFLFLVMDRDRSLEDTPERSRWDRPWRLAAGAAFGAAIATKWSGGLFLIAGLVLTVAWAWAARRDQPLGARVRSLVRSEGPSIAIFLIVVPVVLYAFTYVGRVGGSVTGAPWKQGHVVRALWDHHDYMLDFHRNLASQHTYQSPGWSWIAIKRPVSYYFCSDSTDPPCPEGEAGDYGEIFATGNPFVWWTSVLALLYVAYRWIRTRNFRGPEGVILAGVAFTYLPWITPMLDRPAIFIFYLLPTIPFMCLAIGYVATRIGTSWEAKSAVALFTVATIGVFGFYHPLLVGDPIPQSEWDERIWVFDNCDKPIGGPATSTVTETVGGEITTRVVETTSDTSGLPPTGWCWI